MTYQRVCNMSTMTSATSRAETAYSSGAPEFTPVFSKCSVFQSLIFCVVFCPSLFIFLFFFFWPLHCLSISEFTASNCPFAVNKLLSFTLYHLYHDGQSYCWMKTGQSSNYPLHKVNLSYNHDLIADPDGMCMFCRSLFVLLYFFFWPLCCLFFFDLRILITPLVSSNSSYKHIILPCIESRLSTVALSEDHLTNLKIIRYIFKKSFGRDMNVSSLIQPHRWCNG